MIQGVKWKSEVQVERNNQNVVHDNLCRCPPTWARLPTVRRTGENMRR